MVTFFNCMRSLCNPLEQEPRRNRQILGVAMILAQRE